MEKISIYTVTHKNFNSNFLNLDGSYKIIRVGEFGEKNSVHLSDRKGESIFEKNPNYCELTALYWIWKNDKESEFVGLCHYRRYFTKYKISRSVSGILKEKNFLKILDKYDVLAAKKMYSVRGAYRAYLDCGRERDLDLTEEAIWQLYPEYMNSYNKMFKYASGNYPANMFVMSKKHSDEYCKWLFDILAYVEERADLSDYTQQEARIYGYLSERLLGVWLDFNGFKVKELRIINSEEQVSLTAKIIDILSLIGIYQIIKRVLYKLRMKAARNGD